MIGGSANKFNAKNSKMTQFGKISVFFVVASFGCVDAALNKAPQAATTNSQAATKIQAFFRGNHERSQQLKFKCTGNIANGWRYQFQSVPGTEIPEDIGSISLTFKDWLQAIEGFHAAVKQGSWFPLLFRSETDTEMRKNKIPHKTLQAARKICYEEKTNWLFGLVGGKEKNRAPALSHYYDSLLAVVRGTLKGKSLLDSPIWILFLENIRKTSKEAAATKIQGLLRRRKTKPI